MKLILVRHGATEWSVTGQHTGTTDIPLTSEGVIQGRRAALAVAKLLGDEMESVPIFSSPLGRARITAGLVFGEDRPLRIDGDLTEYNYGRYEGLTPAQIRDIAPGWDIWRDGCPDGETCEMVGNRVDRFLLAAEAAGPTVAAVAHGHLIRILAARAVGLPPEQGQIFTLDTATVSVIEDVRGKRVLKIWNLDPRLLAE